MLTLRDKIKDYDAITAYLCSHLNNQEEYNNSTNIFFKKINLKNMNLCDDEIIEYFFLNENNKIFVKNNLKEIYPKEYFKYKYQILGTEYNQNKNCKEWIILFIFNSNFNINKIKINIHNSCKILFKNDGYLKDEYMDNNEIISSLINETIKKNLNNKNENNSKINPDKNQNINDDNHYENNEILSPLTIYTQEEMSEISFLKNVLDLLLKYEKEELYKKEVLKKEIFFLIKDVLLHNND